MTRVQEASITFVGSDPIHRGAPTPYYAQLASILRAQIGDGTYGPGDPLPAESELCATFGLSRTVVRQALDELVAEGLVQKERGRGSFVTKPKVADLVVQELRGFSDEMGARGHEIGTIILGQEITVVPQQFAADLGLRYGAKVVHIVRVRTANGDPLVKVDTYLPLPRFRRMATMDLEGRSLYEALEDGFGVRPKGGRRRIEAVVANRELADILGVEVGSPMLELTALTTDEDGIAFELFRAYYRGDRTSFEVRV
jgi:GntR family transcriptional regulator